jgi:cytochrome c biogenesis protein ResB
MNEYRRMNIVIDPDIAEWTAGWANGEYSENLADTASEKGLASLSMIDAAIDEFNEEFDAINGDMSSEDAEDFDRMIKNLEEIRNFWKEHTAEQLGVEKFESDIEYDDTDYGTTPEEESQRMENPGDDD